MEERRQEQKVQQKPDRIAAPEEKSDNSPLEQAFGAGVFAEVARDVGEDDRARRRENAQVGQLEFLKPNFDSVYLNENEVWDSSQASN